MKACIPSYTFIVEHETKLNLGRNMPFSQYNPPTSGWWCGHLENSSISFYTGGLLAPNPVHVLTNSCLMEYTSAFYLTLKGGSPGMSFVDRGDLRRGIPGTNMNMDCRPDKCYCAPALRNLKLQDTSRTHQELI